MSQVYPFSLISDDGRSSPILISLKLVGMARREDAHLQRTSGDSGEERVHFCTHNSLFYGASLVLSYLKWFSENRFRFFFKLRIYLASNKSILNPCGLGRTPCFL